MENIYISKRYEKSIILHIIKNLQNKQQYRVPLILGIHGPSGEGKTFQCESILNELDIKSFLISGGQLENSQAGQPAELIRKTYYTAGNYVQQDKTQKAAVLVINDFDTGVGNWGDLVQYTVNRQTIYGELMHLCDYPTLVQNMTTPRIPIILTGNDFSKLYKPLIRMGRMNCFEWKPTHKEKTNIISTIFDQFQLSQISQLINDLNKFARIKNHSQSDLPVAFYSHLKSALVDGALWKTIKKDGAKLVLTDHLNGKSISINNNLKLEEVIYAGKEMIINSIFISHLKE
jgi:hypothetical protein